MATAEEMNQLSLFLQSTGYEQEEANGLIQDCSAAVFDEYITDCPGYAGKIMSVIWSGSPSFFDVYIWENGEIVRSGRDYDDHECSKCGASNGTLCSGCWREYSMKQSSTLIS